jgi:hypothetical protein
VVVWHRWRAQKQQQHLEGGVEKSDHICFDHARLFAEACRAERLDKVPQRHGERARAEQEEVAAEDQVDVPYGVFEQNITQNGQFLAVRIRPATEWATADRSSRPEGRLVQIRRRPRAQF